MIVKQIYNTKNKSQLMIKLPEDFIGKDRILVVLDDSVDTKAKKMRLMKKASKDPLFIADISTIADELK